MFFRRKQTAPPPTPLETDVNYAAGATDFVPFEVERFDRGLPVRTADLERFVVEDPAHTPHERLLWQRFCTLLSAVLHHEYLAWLHSLKDLYGPIDPDSEEVDLERGSRQLTEGADEKFLKAFRATLTRANFQQLELAEVQRAVEAPNERGLNYVPNFGLFEHLHVYARGHTQVTRNIRNLGTRFRSRPIRLAAFRRLVVALKFRPSKKLGPLVRTDVVYIRLFKDVPFVDMEMHLPEQGTKIRMRAIDRAQIASPLLVGLPTFALKLFQLTLLSPMALGGILIAPLTAGVNSFFGFHRAKQRHMFNMIRNLYYLTLANNANVLSCLVDSAEAEDFKETLLAYYVLLGAEKCDVKKCAARLDAAVERLIARLGKIKVDFDVADALSKLTRLGLVEKQADETLVPAPLEEALRILDHRWDHQFPYANRTREAAKEKLSNV